MKQLKIYSIVCSLLFSFFAFANEYKIDGIYPASWWVGLKNPKLQILLRGSNIQENRFSIAYPGVRLEKVNKPENRNYVFLDLVISATARPGIMQIILTNPAGTGKVDFPLKARRSGNGTAFATGVRQEDFVYLLLPDRFSNGDPSNDAYPDMLDRQSDNSNPFLRHGGDIQGVTNHLDYLKSLGITALWMTPVTENNTSQTNEGGTMRSSYHGYHFTNHFEIDKRYGGNDAYKKLSDELHKRGMKLIQDAVYNHVGKDHPLVTDLPMKDWVNQWPSFQITSYKDQPLVDPYASKTDKKISEAGWFTTFLPDLNQRNPYVANFLIQYAIWNTEEFGLDAWRVDTYFYSDSNFLNRVNAALWKEYPRITVFGEAWLHNPVNSAFFCQNNLDISFKHNLHGCDLAKATLTLFDKLKYKALFGHDREVA